MIKVVLVSQLNVVSEGLALIINSQEDMRVLGIMNDQNSSKMELNKQHPDVILLHTTLINTKTGATIHAYKKQYPEVKLIYISPGFTKHLFFDTAMNKPDGFLTDDFPPEKFVEMIREVHKNEYILSGEIAKELINAIQHIDELKKLVLRKQLEERNIGATLRDLDVLYLIYLEKDNKEITKLLRLPDKSVRYYVSKAYKKLERKNRSEAIEFLQELIDK